MDVDTLFSSLCAMGFDSISVERVIGQGNLTLESALDSLTRSSQTPLTFNQVNSGPVLRLGHPDNTNGVTINSPSLPFIQPISVPNDGTVHGSISPPIHTVSDEANKSAPKSRYQDRTSETLKMHEMERQQLAKEMREDKLRKSLAREQALASIRDDREALKCRQVIPESGQEALVTPQTPLVSATGSGATSDMTRIQVCDELSGSGSRHCYNERFNPDLITFKDLVDWFINARAKTTHPTSSVPIDLDNFIQARWRLVLRTSPHPRVLMGSEDLDKSLRHLELIPSAKLFAVISPIAAAKTADSEAMEIEVESGESNPLGDEEKVGMDTETELKDDNTVRLEIQLPSRQLWSHTYPVSTLLSIVMSDMISHNPKLPPLSRLQLVHTTSHTQPINPSTNHSRSLAQLGLTHTARLTCRVLFEMPASSHTMSKGGASSSGQSSSGAGSLPPGSFVRPPLPAMTPQQHAARAALKRFDVAPQVSPNGTSPSDNQQLYHFNRVPSLSELCIRMIQRQLVNSPHTVEGVRYIPANLVQTLISRLSQEMQFKPNIAKMFRDSVTELNLACKPMVTNELLKTLGVYWRPLVSLVLDGSDAMFTDEGLWALKDLHHLKSLSLKGCIKITDYGLQVIAFLPQLMSLSVRQTHITDAGFRLLPESFSRSGITSNIHSLDLSNVPITSASLAIFNQLFPTLKNLNISSTQISDPLSLPVLPHLVSLQVSHCSSLHLTPDSLHIIQLQPSIVDFRCRGLQLHSLSLLLAALKEKPLTRLDGILENGSTITTADLETFASFPLKHLELERCDWLTDSKLALIGRLSNSLMHLSISHCYSVTCEGVTGLTTFTHLLSLNLTGLRSMPEGTYLSLVMSLPAVVNVSISGISTTEQEQLTTAIGHRCKLAFSTHVTRSLPIPAGAL